MEKQLIERVPRYYEPYVNDCFANAYAAVLLHMGQDPKIILSDYLSFMYEKETEYIGTNFLFRFSTSVEFTEEELNTSYEFAYSPATTPYSEWVGNSGRKKAEEKIHFNFFIEDDEEVAYARLKQLIDANRPVIAVVDLFEMRYHRAYQKEHGVHAIVITGYDEAEGSLELFDKYALSSSDFDGKLPMDEIHAARTSDSPRVNPMAGEYRRPIRNLWMEVEIGDRFKVTEERLASVIVESCERMAGHRQVLGQSCGIGALDTFRKEMLSKKEQALNEYNQYLFRAYYNEFFKRLKRSRIRFQVFIEQLNFMVPQEIITDVARDLSESAKHWEIAANLALKLGISRRLTLIDDIDKHLKAIMELEERAVDRLYRCRF